MMEQVEAKGMHWQETSSSGPQNSTISVHLIESRIVAPAGTKRQSANDYGFYPLSPLYACFNDDVCSQAGSGEKQYAWSHVRSCSWKGLTIQRLCERMKRDCPSLLTEDTVSNLLELAIVLSVLSKDTSSLKEKKELMQEADINNTLYLSARSIAEAVLVLSKECKHAEVALALAGNDIADDFKTTWQDYCSEDEIEHAWRQIKNGEVEKLPARQDVIVGPGFMENFSKLLPKDTAYFKIEEKKEMQPPSEGGPVRFAFLITRLNMGKENFKELLDKLDRLVSYGEGRVLVCAPLCLDLWTTADSEHLKHRQWVDEWKFERKRSSVVWIGSETEDKKQYYHRSGELLEYDVSDRRLCVYGKALNEELISEGFVTVLQQLKDIKSIPRRGIQWVTQQGAGGPMRNGNYQRGTNYPRGTRGASRGPGRYNNYAKSHYKQ